MTKICKGKNKKQKSTHTTHVVSHSITHPTVTNNVPSVTFYPPQQSSATPLVCFYLTYPY